MSVSSEIQQLATNLNNIKQSIIDQGGTIDEGAGFNAISAAVETISGGGGGEPEPITPYGYIYYHPYTLGYTAVTFGDEGVTVDSIDQAKYANWLSSNGFDLDNEVSFMYESGGWRAEQWSPSMVEATLTTAELSSVAGISVTVTSTEMAQFQVKKGPVIDKTTTLELEIASLADFQSLVNTTYDLNTIMHLSNADICCNGVIKFVFGGSITSIPNNFLRYTSTESISVIPSGVTTIGDYFMFCCASLNCDIDFCNVTSVGQNCLSGVASFNGNVKADKLATIGDYFLYNAGKFNQPLSLPAVKTIGGYFMRFCKGFNKPISLGQVESISTAFMYECTNFNQPITIPSTVQSIGSSSAQNFMVNCQNMISPITIEAPSSVFLSQTADRYSFSAGGSAYPCYTTGITLTGTYASDWKNFFPDITDRLPYRKLLVANA